MSSAVHRSKRGMRRRRWLAVGAVAGAVAIAVSVIVLTTGGRPHQSRAQSRASATPTTSASANASASPRPKPSSSETPTSGRIQSSGLTSCPRPGRSTSSGGWNLIATTSGTISGYARPGGPPSSTIPATWYGAVSALPVIARQPGWLEVRLATRPNGSSAWVRQADVALTVSPYWISVDLATRHLALFRLDQQVVSAPAGVGTAQDPTPTGQFFVAFLEASPSAGYGPFIMVTSAHSTSIANWEGSGDAVIGIHGPLGADSLIGSSGAYLSHGCIRIPIADLTLLRDVPAGSPISICG